jgi:antitoxin MazE
MNHIVHAKVQKWGNSLGIRISGLVRELTNFEADADVTIEIFENGFTVKKCEPIELKRLFSEEELLSDISEMTAHTDLLVSPSDKELGFK